MPSLRAFQAEQHACENSGAKIDVQSQRSETEFRDRAPGSKAVTDGEVHYEEHDFDLFPVSAQIRLEFSNVSPERRVRTVPRYEKTKDTFGASPTLAATLGLKKTSLRATRLTKNGAFPSSVMSVVPIPTTANHKRRHGSVRATGVQSAKLPRSSR